MQETEPIETAPVIESTTETTVDPIYKHKDGRILTKTQLIKMGLNDQRINDGISKKIITQIGDTEDPTQEFKHKDGRTLSVKDLTAQGVTKDRIANGLELGMIVPIEKKNLLPSETPSAPPPEAAKDLSAGVSISTTPATEAEVKPAETPTDNTYTDIKTEPSKAPVPKEIGDPITLALKAFELQNKKIKYEGSPASGKGGRVFYEKTDEAAVVESKKIKEDLKAQGIDADDLYEKIKDLPNEVYQWKVTQKDGTTVYPYSKEAIAKMYIEDPHRFNEFVNNATNRVALQKAVSEIPQKERADMGISPISVMNEYNSLNKASDFQTWKNNNVERQKELINTYIPNLDDRKVALNRLESNASTNINSTNPSVLNEYNESPLKDKLDVNQYAALQLKKIFHPDEYNQVINFLEAKPTPTYTTESGRGVGFKPGAGMVETERYIDQKIAKESILKDLSDRGKSDALNSLYKENSELTKAIQSLPQDVEAPLVERYNQNILNIDKVTKENEQVKKDIEQSLGKYRNQYIEKYNKNISVMQSLLQDNENIGAKLKSLPENDRDQLLTKYNENIAEINNIKSDAEKDAEKYPELTKLKYDKQAKDFMQQAGFSAGGYAGKRLVQGFVNTGGSLDNVMVSLFGDKKANVLNQMIKLGEKKTEENDFYLPEVYQGTGGLFLTKFDKPLSDKIKTITKGKDLSDLSTSDFEQVKYVLSQNQNSISTITNPQAGKNKNFFSLATLYSNAGMVGDVVSFGVQAGLLSAVGVSSVLAQAIPLWTTSQNDFYKEGVAKGMSDPDGYANVHATIMFLAGLISPKLDSVKKIVGLNSKAGQLLAGVSEETWNAVLSKNKPLINRIANSLKTTAMGSGKEVLKMGAIFGAGTSIGGDIVNKHMYNENIGYNQMVDNAMESTKHLVTSSIGLLGFGALSHLVKGVSTLDKASLWQLSDNKENNLLRVDEAVKDGTISAEDGKSRKKIINDVNDIVSKMPSKDAKGNLMTDQDKLDYFYNLLIKKKLNEDKSTLPNAQQEKFDYAMMVDDHLNDLIIDPKQTRQLEKRKAKLEKMLAAQKDKYRKTIELNPKEELNAKAELEAINAHLKNQENKLTPTQTPEEVLSGVAAPVVSTEEAVQPTPVADITVGELLDKAGSYKGQKGSFYQDGQRVIFKVEGANKEYDLGNIGEIKDTPINQFGIEHEESVVNVNDDGTFNVRGATLRNGYSDPMQAINRDADGKPISVTLDTPDGKKRTFRGDVAQDIAYQITLKEITKDAATTTEFEQFINEPNQQQQINTAAVPAVTAEVTATANEPVQRETLQPTVPAITTAKTIETKEVDIKKTRQQELEKLPFDDDAKLKLEAAKTKGEERYFRQLKTEAGKLQEGNVILDRHKAEDILSNPNSTIEERVTAKAHLQNAAIGINGAFISEISRAITEELSTVPSGEGKAYWNNRTRELKKIYDAELAAAEPTIEAIDQQEVIKQMKPITDKMVEIEREFQNQGFTIDTDYDNEITVTDKKGELMEAEDLPKDLRGLAAQYETVTAKLGEFDDAAREKALAESRKVTEVEAEAVEPEKKQIEAVDDGLDYVRSKYKEGESGGKDLSEKEATILNKNLNNLIDRAEKENKVERNNLKQATWKTNDGYVISEFYENGKGGTRIITPKGEEINIFDKKYKGESGQKISYFSKAHEAKAEPAKIEEARQKGDPVVGDTYTYPRSKAEFELVSVGKNGNVIIKDVKTGEESTVTDNVFDDLVNKKTGKARWEIKEESQPEEADAQEVAREDWQNELNNSGYSYGQYGGKASNTYYIKDGAGKVVKEIKFTDANEGRNEVYKWIDKQAGTKIFEKNEKLRQVAQKKAKPVENGSEVEFKTHTQTPAKGIKVEIPGLENIDTILVQDGMTYEVYELATGMKLADTENAMSPAEAVKTIASKIPGGVAQRILSRIYQSEEAGRYRIAGEKGGVDILNDSPAYNLYKQQKLAEAENKPFIHNEAARNEFINLAAQARTDGYIGAADMIEAIANAREGTVPVTLDQAKSILEKTKIKKDLIDRKLKNIPYPESEKIERNSTEAGLIDAVQAGFKRDRWNNLPEDIKNAALEAWKKEAAIYNKYGYYPVSFTGGESFFGVMLTLGKYIASGLSKDAAKREGRVKEDLQTMKDNFKRIDEIYKQEGFDALKAPEGQTPKPLTTIETPLPPGAKAAFDRIKNRLQKILNPVESKTEKKPFSIDNKEDFYHGSFNKREGQLRTNTAEQFGDAIYFTTSKEEAEGNYPHVTKVKLNIENPIYAGEGKWNEVEKLALEKENANKERNEDGKIIGEVTDLADIKNSNNISDAARELGYDAIISKGEGNHQNETAVLDPSKIIYPEDIAELPQQKGVGETAQVRQVKVSDLKTDEEAFQNREGLNLDKVDAIVKNYNPSEFDPIVYWTDENGNKITLNHHRFEAAKRLGLEDIPARPLTYPAGHPKAGEIVPATDKAEASDYAINRSNANRSMETALERAKALRRLKESGASKEKIDEFLAAEGKNKTKVLNFSALNPNGKTVEALRIFGDSEDVQTQKATEQSADWIGEARRTIAGLTDAHENEMLDFLFDKSRAKRITTKADFLQKVRASVKPLTPSEPLNIARFEYKTEGESVYETEVNDLKEKLANRQSQINEINERFTNPNAKDYIPTESKDYAETRRIADEKIASIDAERKAIQKQLETVYSNKGKYTGGASSGTLFSYREAKPEDFEDYVEGVTDMINQSPEKTLQQVQAEVANEFENNTPEFKKTIELAYNEAKNNVTGKVVKTEILKKLNQGFLKIGSTIFDNAKQLMDKAKQLSGSRFNALDNTAGFETRDGKSIGFNYDTDQVARERFDFSKLKRIGEGSDRVVFDLGNGKVLKVAKTARGLEQNIYEGDNYLTVIPEVFERGLNYVVTENIPRIKGEDAVPIYDAETGQEIGTSTAGKMLRELSQFNQRDFDRQESKLQDALAKYGLEDVTSYELLYNDFIASRNWGYKDGKAYLIDAGTLGGIQMLDRYKGVKNLSDPDFRKIYTESKNLKKEYADSDKYTKFHYDENGEILGFTHGGHIYLNGEKITAKTTMEEAGHIWINHAKETNPSLYNSGLKKVLKSKYLSDVSNSSFYKKEALKLGKEGSIEYNNYMQEEALAKAISDEGAKFVTDAQKIDFKQWVTEMWNNVKKAFGIRDLTAEQVAKLSLKDFAKMAAADVFAEEAPKGETKKTIVQETVNAEGNKESEEIVVTTKNPYLYEGTEARQRGLYKHMMEADNVSQQTKDFLKKNGITYEAADNAQAELMAEDILKTYGTKDALQIARGSDVHASVRSAIYAKAIDAAYIKEMSAKTPQEKMKAAQEWKDLVTEYANQLTAGGQFTAYAAHFYRTSPMGFVMKENADRAERFNEWEKGKEKTLEELWNEINSTAEGRSMINLEADKAKKAEREAERKIRDKKIDDFFDKLKINPKNTYGFIIPLGVLNPVIDGMKLAVKAGDRIADVVQRAIEQISDKVGDSWNKEAFRKDYEEMLTKLAGKPKESEEAVQLKKRLEGLEKQIENLKERISKGGEPGEKKEKKFSDIPEVQKLIEERDKLKEENEKLLKQGKVGKYSDAEIIEKSKKAAKESIVELERQLRENDIDIKNKKSPTDAELIDYRNKQKDLRKQIEDKRKAQKVGKYSDQEVANAEAKRKQARIDELNRRINQNDFSAEKEKLKKQKTVLDDELADTKKRYDEAKKQSPEFKEKKSAQFLDRLRKRLEGVSDAKRKEIIARSLKQITEAGGLKYDEFRTIVAETMGYKDLTPAEVAEIESLTTTINSVDAAEDALVANPTEANLRALDKARQDAMTAGLKLYNKAHRPADIPRVFSSFITGNLLGAITLGKNIIQNVVMQATMRAPKALIIQPSESAIFWLGNKMAGSKAFNPSTNIFLAQPGYFKGGSRGIKRGWFNFYKGTQERDYFGKVSYQSTIAPREAVRDLKLYFSGEKPLTKTELFERSLRATGGWQPDFILRAMGFGDKPFRWAAEGAAAVQIAKLELKLSGDNEINAFMYAPKKFAYQELVKQGVPKDEAALRAAEIEERIIEAGSKAVLEQENALSWASKKLDTWFVTKKNDPAFKKAVLGGLAIGKTATFPFVKIPANVYWQMFKVANPEIALLQGLYHGGKAFFDAKGGNKAESRKQYENTKDNFATAIFGYGLSVAIAGLVTNGYVRPENDEETKAREREGEKPYAKGNQLNWGRMMGGEDYWIDLSWFGPVGTTMGVQAKIQDEKRKAAIKNKPVDDSWAADFSDRFTTAEMASLNNLVFDQAGRTVAAIKGGNNALDIWSVNMMNTGMNMITGATYVAMSKAMLPEIPRLKAEGVMEEFKNNQLQRNILYRMYKGSNPPPRISIWGEPIKQDTTFSGVLSNMLGLQQSDAKQFGAILYYDAQRTGDMRFFPSPVTDKVTVDGEEIKLTQNQKDELSEYIGKSRAMLVGSFVYDCAFPFEVPIAGKEAKKLKYNDKDFSDKDKIHALQMIYDYGRELGFAQFQKMHKEFVAADLTPTQIVEQVKREVYDMKFKLLGLEKVAREKGKELPPLSPEEQAVADEIENNNENPK